MLHVNHVHSVNVQYIPLAFEKCTTAVFSSLATLVVILLVLCELKFQAIDATYVLQAISLSLYQQQNVCGSNVGGILL